MTHDPHGQGERVIIPADLLRAYEATDYRVYAAAGRIVLNVGRLLDEPDALPNFTRLAIITANNPFSAVLEDAENAARQAALVDAVARAGLIWFPAVGVDARGEWPPEPSLAILDPMDPQLDEWMEVFGQNAVVVADRGTTISLRLHPRSAISSSAAGPCSHGQEGPAIEGHLTALVVQSRNGCSA